MNREDYDELKQLLKEAHEIAHLGALMEDDDEGHISNVSDYIREALEAIKDVPPESDQ